MGRTNISNNVASFLDSADDSVRDMHDSLIAAGLTSVYSRYLAHAEIEQLAAFFRDLTLVDLDWIARHRHALQDGGTGGDVEDLSPVDPGRIEADNREGLEEAGRESLRAGEWSALVFAGGAATRFYAGSDIDDHPPKGLFPVSPVMGRCFIEMFVAQALAAGIESGRMPFVLLMTSRLTQGPIQDFIRTAGLGGFPRDFVVILPQSEHPRLDREGDLIARPDGRLFFTGDGHGGVFRALLKPGSDGQTTATRLSLAGVKRLVLHNVDNAAAAAFDAARIGYHVKGDFRFTLSAVPRTRPDEKVGIIARNERSDRVECVEYSVCPRELAEATMPGGSPLFSLAHICTNLADLRAIRDDLKPTLYTGKEVRVGDRTVESSTLEMLNQDLSGLLDARDVGVLLLQRDSFFLPTKNLSGSASLQTTRKALAQQGRLRLSDAGARVHPDAVLEIDACMGSDTDDLRKAGAGPGWEIGSGAKIAMGVLLGPDGSPPFSPGLSVGKDATFKLSADLPYGEVEVDPETRKVRTHPESAGKLKIGRDVIVKPGADVSIDVKGDGCLLIPEGSVLSGRVDVTVEPGTIMELDLTTRS